MLKANDSCFIGPNEVARDHQPRQRRRDHAGRDVRAAEVTLLGFCSPHGAKRNAGTAYRNIARLIPDYATLHPGYGSQGIPHVRRFPENPLSLFDIKGKTAIVTGASGAFGALAAKVLAGRRRQCGAGGEQDRGTEESRGRLRGARRQNRDRRQAAVVRRRTATPSLRRRWRNSAASTSWWWPPASTRWRRSSTRSPRISST